MTAAKEDRNGTCPYHSGVKSDIEHLDREHSCFRAKDNELGKEINSMKKWLLGFMVALLLGVYGSLLYQVKGQPTATVQAHVLAEELIKILEKK